MQEFFLLYALPRLNLGRAEPRQGIPLYLRKPKALRHGFGAAAVTNSVVITLIKKWLGHARIETTEHYTMLLGKEERMLAKGTWHDIRRELRL